MKYDLKAMEFDPDADNLPYAFLWHETPDGESYWSYQCRKGITTEGQAKWDAMKQQWNEENGVERETGTLAELDVKPGDVVEFIQTGRRTKITHFSNGHYYGDGKNPGWPYSDTHIFRIISRASDTPAQRYVVLTDGETLICTRYEAEDLAASGGVDAVYKLGDKVEVNVKVEFE